MELISRPESCFSTYFAVPILPCFIIIIYNICTNVLYVCMCVCVCVSVADTGGPSAMNGAPKSRLLSMSAKTKSNNNNNK